jgi:imidazolonepropionase-like amidohydrolase
MPRSRARDTASRSRPLVALVAAVVLSVSVQGVSAQEGSPGYHPHAHAIKGARILTGTGDPIDDGTIVVRDGLIVAVGKTADVAIPFDAKIIDGKDLTVTPGFIDLYTTAGASPGVERSITGPGRSTNLVDYPLAGTPEDDRVGITPEFRVVDSVKLPESFASARRRLGFTTLLAAPGGAIVTGQSALVSLSGLPRRETIVQPTVALHVRLGSPEAPASLRSSDDPTSATFQGAGRGYPSALMGIVAHLRQAMNDAEYHAAQLDWFAKQGGPRPPTDPSLDVLHQARAGSLPVWWEADTADEIHRALDLAAEFGTSIVIVGGKEAAKVVDRLKATKTPVVLRLDWSDEPKVPSESDYAKKKAAERDWPLSVMKFRAEEWKNRVATAAKLAEAGVPFALSTDKLSNASDLPKKLRELIKAGLPKEAALTSLTRSAASIAGVADRLGTLEPGKLAHLVVWSGPIEEEKTQVKHVLVDGLALETKEDTGRGAAGSGGPGGPGGQGFPGRPEGIRGSRPGGGRQQGQRPGGQPGEPDAPVPDRRTPPDDPGDADHSQDPKESPEKSSETPDKPESEKGKDDDNKKADDGKKDEPAKPYVDPPAEFDADRKPALQTGGNVLIRHARILTGAAKGTIPNGSILVRDGKIASVAEGEIEAPEGVTVIDAKGLVVTPGIIDTHSHMAVSGGVNEATLSIVPEVRVRDVIDSDDVNLHHARAGGVTAARLLHGSANVIGGQDAVIKLKYGQPAASLLLQDDKRPTGVKFALGENVTRNTARFPNTRMGVESTLDRAFDEGRVYAERLKAHRDLIARGEPVPPFRRDLRLEALANLRGGSFKIHSHCYRVDEILMLLRTAERHGIRVQSLQHVLEGYKVAPEIAAHGASASTFSDWWAYKVEAYDAIPYNAALLRTAGASVCIKSDSEELVRHLYHEAAKMVRYGGATEAEALAMITLNPARELGLDHRLGSIEVGKDADLAMFNAHPFDAYTRCELTLIDGEVAYQRPKDLAELALREGSDGSMPMADPSLVQRAIEIAPSSGDRYALVGATAHPVTGQAVPNATVLIDGGRITAIGGADLAVPAGYTTVALAGLDVWPGLIDAASIVGLSEIGSLRVTQDFEEGARMAPELHTSVALKPDSALVGVTRTNGVLAVFAQPTGGTVAGQGCVANLAGWVPPEMVVADSAALVVNIPSYTPEDPDRPRRPGMGGPGGGGGGGDANRARTERLDQIRELFREAREYDRVRSEATAKGQPLEVAEPRLAALVPYLKKEKPVVFRADKKREILDALELAKDLDVKPVISGGLEASIVIDELKEAGAPVILTGVLRMPQTKFTPTDAPYQTAAKLHAAGVPFAIRSTVEGADPATTARNVPFEAAFAVAHGLPEAAAIEAVTIAPARILGVANSLGSIEPGKVANLVVTAGPVLQITTPVKALFIGGKPVGLGNRQTELYEKYRGRIEEVKAGSSPLGLERKTPVTASGPAAVAPVPTPAPAPAGAPVPAGR